MNIACNTRCLDAKVTGVQRYTRSILKYFPIQTYRTIQPSETFSHGIKGHLWEQSVLPGLIGKSEMLWSPCNTGPLSVKKQIVTFHDCVPIDHPEWVTPTFAKWYKFLQPRLAKNVNHIIAISEFTKQRVIENFKVNENKISVVLNGVDDYFFLEPEMDFKSHIPFEKYILVLGALEPRKNLAGILEAWKVVMNKIDPDIGLVVVGGKADNSVFGKYNLDESVQRVHFTGYVDEKYIVSIYKGAMFFVYMSFYEGFGLPPLEAMATGCPVLSSNTSAIIEVVQNAGLLVDPKSTLEIQAAIVRYCEDSVLRNKNSILGKQIAQKFLWAETSKKTYEILNMN